MLVRAELKQNDSPDFKRNRGGASAHGCVSDSGPGGREIFRFGAGRYSGRDVNNSPYGARSGGVHRFRPAFDSCVTVLCVDGDP